MKGHEHIGSKTLADVHDDGAPARSTTVAHSNVFSGMESADMLEAQLRARRQRSSGEQQMKADLWSQG